jgi:WD40 repeat protein
VDDLYSENAPLFLVRNQMGHSVWKSQATSSGQDCQFNAIAFLPYDRMLAGGSQDGSVKLWDVALTLTLSQREREVFLTGCQITGIPSDSRRAYTQSTATLPIARLTGS